LATQTLTFQPESAGAGVQESIPTGVSVFQQEPEQNHEWAFLIGTGAGVIFNKSVLILVVYSQFI